MAFSSVVRSAKTKSNHQLQAESEKRHTEGIYEEATRNRVAKFVSLPQKELGKLNAFKDRLLGKAQRARGRTGDGTSTHRETMQKFREFSKERKLGDRSRFGDGDGSWWDRWLCQHPPPVSSLSSCYAHPKSGFKRREPIRFTVPITQEDLKDKVELTKAFKGRETSEMELRRTRGASFDVSDQGSDKGDNDRLGQAEEGDDFLDDFNTQAAREKALRFEKMVAESTTRLLVRIGRPDIHAS